MSPKCLDLLLDRVEAVPTDSNVYVFVAVLACGAAGESRVPIPVEAMLSYSLFQKTVLLTTGLLYLNMGCEGRAEASADEAWKYSMQVALDRGRATAGATVTN
jgi:hypothetical protein